MKSNITRYICIFFAKKDLFFILKQYSHLVFKCAW